MAKGQKRSSREAKKPKQPKSKPIAAAWPFAVAWMQATPAPVRKG